MPSGKTALLLTFIAILSLTAACSPGGRDPVPGAESTPGLCDNPLYPVRYEAAWTYLSTGSPSGDFSYTDTVTEVRADGFTLTTQFANIARTQEWTCEADGLKALQPGGAGAAASITMQGASAGFNSSDVTGFSIPREIAPGMTWQYSLKLEGVTAMPGDQNAPSSGTFSLTMQEMGWETVTVPAGTFAAEKFQATSLTQVNADFQGLQVPITMNSTSIIWYAPGVGHVKTVENSDFGGTPYTSTTELQSYNIP